MSRRPLLVFGACAAILGLVLSASCGGSGGGGNLPSTVSFLVTDSAGLPVAGATVYLVPVTAIDRRPIDGVDVLDGSAEDRDEPLEDAVSQKGFTFRRAVTGADGSATISGVSLGRYYWFVSPSDGEHLPGGSGCRDAVNANIILGTTVPVTVSSAPPATASYLGSTACISCHPAYEAAKTHAHRLGFSVPGSFSALQDPVRYPDFTGQWDLFLPAAAYTGGTEVYYSNFDPLQGFDKFLATTSPPNPGTVYVKAWLWRDTFDQKYKITLENVINPADPGSPKTYVVELTYGGAVYKQRLLLRVPGRQGLYPLQQWQTEGDDARAERSRKTFRDYHLDWYWDDLTQTLKDPPLGKNFEGNCTACHSTGFVRYQDPITGEWLSDAVDDPNGAYDIDGDGTQDEINLGCEVCHGPGSAHLQWVVDPANAGHEARYIVTPGNLSPSREMMICGRCHDRPLGNWAVLNEEPLNPQAEFPPPGIKRSDYLASYVSRKGPGAANYWSDDLHSKSHHQQYSDQLKSPKYRNDRILVTCSDCHNSHGFGPFRHQLDYDPTDPNSLLCARCHAVDLVPHMIQKTAVTHAGENTYCFLCHMANTAQTGSGVYGILLGVPTGDPSDLDITYYQNDIQSHLFMGVTSKNHPDVIGKVPAFAMPVPYTNSCGTGCHDPSNLPNINPLSLQSPAAPSGGGGVEDDDYGPNNSAEK